MIIQNAIMIVEDWPEVSFLVSVHVHDYQSHTFHDGTSVAVDGGHDYIRRCYPPKMKGYGTKYMDYSLDDQEPFDTIKHKLLWGTRGKDGFQPLKWVRLIDCDAKHLQAILDYPYTVGKQLHPIYKEVIKDILVNNKKVAPAPPRQRRYIHKAARPKYHYMNPTVCSNLNMSDVDAQKHSRTRWTNVTCPECLKKRKHNDF
jgi:hypothetical protein